MRMEGESDAETEWRNFRYMLFAMHPNEAAALLKDVDEAREKMEYEQEMGVPEFAAELTWEEMDEYVPFSAEEVEATLALARRFGFAMTDE